MNRLFDLAVDGAGTAVILMGYLVLLVFSPLIAVFAVLGVIGRKMHFNLPMSEREK